MNQDIKMSVSSLTRKDGEKKIYVLFTDQDKMAEFSLPEEINLYNKGFSEDDIKKLLEYLKNNKEKIYEISKEINPIKAFMK